MGQLDSGGGPEGIGTAPTPEHAVQASGSAWQLPRWGVLLLAALLLGSWSTWAVHAYRADPRVVTMEEARSDLSAGIVRSYDGITAMRPDRAWPPTDASSYYDTAPIPDPGAPSSRYPAFVAVGYHVDAWAAPIRIVKVEPTNDGSDVLDVFEIVQELEAAGVGPRDSMPEQPPEASPREWADLSGMTAGLLALVALFAIRPTRGTRWFWFWVFGTPLGLGVLAYVVAECLLPKRAAPPPDGVRVQGRLSGLVGFLIQVATKFLVPF